MKGKGKDLEEGVTRNKDGSYSVEIDPEIYEGYQKLVDEHNKKLKKSQK